MPRVVDHAARRREIVHAVWFLLATRGPDAVSLRTVAGEAGVSVGRIQHYFAGKDDLLRRGCEAMIELAEEGFADDPEEDPDPAGTLRRLVTQVVPATEEFRLGTTVWFAYLALGAGDREIARLIAGAKRGQEELAVRLVRRVVAARGIRRGTDATATARRLLATADGLSVRVLVGDLSAADALSLLDAELDALRPGAAPRSRPARGRSGGRGSADRNAARPHPA
jgi:TetR/AcrR family transcriptional repressor of bet genes